MAGRQSAEKKLAMPHPIAYSVRYRDDRGQWQTFTHAQRARVRGFAMLQRAAGRETEPIKPVMR